MLEAGALPCGRAGVKCLMRLSTAVNGQQTESASFEGSISTWQLYPQLLQDASTTQLPGTALDVPSHAAWDGDKPFVPLVGSNDHSLLKIKVNRAWSGGSVVESACCSGRGPGWVPSAHTLQHATACYYNCRGIRRPLLDSAGICAHVTVEIEQWFSAFLLWFLMW